MNLEMKGISQTDFDQIFINWYDPIRNFIYYKTGDVQMAEDIAQDTFLKIWEKRTEIKVQTVKSLLYTVANNLFINNIEHQKVTFKFVNTNKSTNVANAADYELEMQEFDTLLQKALADLNEKQRTVFLMNRVDELTYNQIAEVLGLSVKAIEKRMEKALVFLRKRIDMKF